MANTGFDLKGRAHRAMIEAGFQPDFPPQVLDELRLIKQRAVSESTRTEARELSSLLWSSIDNDTSRDLEQVEYAEELSNGETRLLIGIADVDSSETKGSAIDQHAAAEATSVYTGLATFP